MANEMIKLAAQAEIAVDTGKRTMVATIASNDLCHDGTVVNALQINLKTYQANPIVLWAHMSFNPPIGVNQWIKRSGNALVAKTQFAQRPATHEGEWLPDVVLDLYAQKVLRGVSAGLKILEQRWDDEITKEDRATLSTSAAKGVKRYIARSEMLEYSCCSIPMNPNALRQALNTHEASTLGFMGIDASMIPEADQQSAEPTGEPTAQGGGEGGSVLFTPLQLEQMGTLMKAVIDEYMAKKPPEIVPLPAPAPPARRDVQAQVITATVASSMMLKAMQGVRVDAAQVNQMVQDAVAMASGKV